MPETRRGVRLHSHLDRRPHAAGDEHRKCHRIKFITYSFVYLLQGTKEGERIKKIVTDGGLVPFELTVQILIKALIACPSEVSYKKD